MHSRPISEKSILLKINRHQLKIVENVLRENVIR